MSEMPKEERAEVALTAYLRTHNAEEEEAIGDLIVDLLHLAAKRGQVVESIMRSARDSYEIEAEEDAATPPGP